jgi:hypothetical protein
MDDFALASWSVTVELLKHLVSRNLAQRSMRARRPPAFNDQLTPTK